MTAGLSPEDVVLFLISGGGSALFEKPLVSGKELEDVTKQLLASGANIKEMNTDTETPVGGKRWSICSACRTGEDIFDCAQ